ncbi:phage portal protein [Priestia aryabhattai]|uniref:phage portal protein n=1 Tax=Priestia aryabhattai TaxID=412384 RepID=UPI003C9F9946
MKTGFQIATIRAAVTTGWTGSNFNFTRWIGRRFWGIENSTLSTNELIFTAITKKSETLASLPLKLYQNHDAVTNDVADVLINSPNVNMTEFDFIRLLEVCRNSAGNGYAIKIPDLRGGVEQLVPLDPSYVEEVFDTKTNELWYKIMGSNGDYYIHNLDILHVKHIHGANSWRGISPIRVLTNTLKFDKAVKEFSISEMEQAPNSFILKYGANVDEEKQAQVVEQFRQFYAENGGVLFQEPGVEIKEMDRKFVAADIASAEKITAKRIANVFSMPVHMLGEGEGQSFGSLEQLMSEFVVMTLMPIVKQYEQEFNRKLLTRDERKAGYYFKFNMNALLRGDTAARTAMYHSGIRDSWLRPDDVRELEDLPPIGGKAAELWISGDMYPLDMDPTMRKSTSSSANSSNNNNSST